VGRTVPGAGRQIAFALAVDVRPDLSAIHVPTLVVAPTDDRFVTPRHSAEPASVKTFSPWPPQYPGIQLVNLNRLYMAG
jgi:pimeloyl-ACP methyl ester carboxylesterase